jgi:hypothetical protein
MSVDDRVQPSAGPLPYALLAFGVGLLLWGSIWGLFYAPRETFMGDVQRILYIHVPTAWNALLALTFAFGCALLSLWQGGWRWDARLEGGLEYEDFAARTGLEARELYSPQIRQLCSAGLIEVTEERMKLTDRGIDVGTEAAERRVVLARDAMAVDLERRHHLDHAALLRRRQREAAERRLHRARFGQPHHREPDRQRHEDYCQLRHR